MIGWFDCYDNVLLLLGLRGEIGLFECYDNVLIRVKGEVGLFECLIF